MDFVSLSLTKFIIGLCSATTAQKLNNVFNKTQVEQINKAFELALKDITTNKIIRDTLRMRFQNYKPEIIHLFTENELTLESEEIEFIELFKNKIIQTDVWKHIQNEYFSKINNSLELIEDNFKSFIQKTFPELQDTLEEIKNYQIKIESLLTPMENSPKDILSFYFQQFDKYQVLLMEHCKLHLPSNNLLKLKSSDEYDDFVSEKLERFIWNQNQFLLLSGGIGSGKTTSLLNLASLQIEKKAEKKIPIYIELSDYDYFNKESLSDYIVKKLKNKSSIDLNVYALEKILSSNKCILILDGLDEVSNLHNIERVKNILSRILEEFKTTNKIIVSLRPTIFRSYSKYLSDIKKELEEFSFQYIHINEMKTEEIISTLDTEKANVDIDLDMINSPLLYNILSEIINKKLDSKLLKIDSRESLIQEFIKRTLSRKRSNRESDGSIKFWFGFLEKCAFSMFLKGTTFLKSFEIVKILESFSSFDNEEFNKYESDAVIRTIFKMSKSGLEFNHNIFNEFLLGSYLSNVLLDFSSDYQHLHNKDISLQTVKSIQYKLPTVYKHMKNKSIRDVDDIVWCYIDKGLNVSCEGGYYYLNYIDKPFYISETLITMGQYKKASLKKYNKPNAFNIKVNDSPEYDKISPINLVSYKKSEEIAKKLFNAHIPSSEQWNRACNYIDCSYPKDFNIPGWKDVKKKFYVFVKQAEHNKFGVYDAVGLLWQWTSTVKNGFNVCKGMQWSAPLKNKLRPGNTLYPTKVEHRNTGFRIIKYILTDEQKK